MYTEVFYLRGKNVCNFNALVLNAYGELSLYGYQKRVEETLNRIKSDHLWHTSPSSAKMDANREKF